MRKDVEYYISIGSLQKKDSDLKQFESYLHMVEVCRRRKFDILTKIINNNLHLKDFLQIHSVFPINPVDFNQLVLFMRDVLYITDKDYDRITRKIPIPDDIFEKIKVFGPELVSFAIEPYTVHYTDGADRKHYDDPIYLKDIDFDRDENSRLTEDEVQGFIAKYDNSDLPF